MLRFAASDPDLLAVLKKGDQHRQLSPQTEKKLSIALNEDSSKLVDLL